ncbi:hypothetical protein VNO78_24586 [Psophocarpus tetragonolobus]|uniref:Uncharacterized protein n=1 Tax=Psophocarpus tetragonolobus TaxID=3891 RepID=A0AAN9XET9_PSOTE
MFGGGLRRLRSSERFTFLTASFSTNAKNSYSFCTSAKNKNKNIIVDERYRQLENLDVVTAAKMLFTHPPQKRKFGLDFHLVQFFFACLPSLVFFSLHTAVYLVAQYAHYEMRKMEVEVDQKRKKQKEEEEEEVKEKEKEMEEKSDPQLAEVKVRLEKLEAAVIEIEVKTKKHSSSNLEKNQVTDGEKKHLNSSAPRDTSSIDTASNKAVDEDHSGKHDILKSKPDLREERECSVATPNTSLQKPKGQNQSGGAS